MLRGTGATSSVIQAAGAPGGGVSARPNALVVLVKTKREAPAATASSSTHRGPVMFVSTNAARSCEPTCGLCSVAAWMTASAPWIASCTSGRSAIEPPQLVGGEGATYTTRT